MLNSLKSFVVRFSRGPWLNRLGLTLLLAVGVGLVGWVWLSPVASTLPARQVVERPGFSPVEEDARPDHPGEALEFRRLTLQDESGNIPPDGVIRAKQHVDAMKAYQAQAKPAAGGIPSVSWTWLGPGNIGGRSRALLIDPLNPDRMWLGSVGGGIWASSNGGVSWQPVDDFMANLAVGSMVLNHITPTIMYAGTGEGFSNADAIRGAGIFKSIDGGANWSQLSSTNNSNWYYVNRLSISPNGGILLAATGSGIWRSLDDGASWTHPTLTRTLDIDFHPTDNSQAVAGGASGGAWYSLDGGVSWQAATGIPVGTARVEVAYALSDPKIVYASLNRNSGEIWKSTDGGQSYAQVNTGNNYLGNQGWYDNVIWVDPTLSTTLVVGGIDLWRSTNGGANLTKISQWYSAPNSAHADHHAIVAHPGFNGTSNRIVFFANDGGLYKANDVSTVSGTSGWQELNNNLGVTQFYGAAGNAASGVIIGGTQDNGTLRYIGGTENWTTMFGGDGGFNAADPTNPNYFYGEYVYLQIHRSTNGGGSSSYIDSGISEAGTSTCANFIAPFILDPNNPNTMLAGGCQLWRSANVKATTPTWASIKPSTTYKISAIAVASGNSDVIWVGHNNGDVYVTINGTGTTPGWTRVDTNTVSLPNRYVTRLTIDPHNSQIVYATFGSFYANNVWRTLDGGATWANVGGSGPTGLPAAPVRSLVINPQNSNQVYAATEVGVFVSESGGTTWSVPHDGPANVSVDELFWLDSQTLIAATHGRGLFKATLGLSLSQVQFDRTAVNVSEAGGSVPLTVTLDSAAPLTVTVNYQTLDHTAQAGSDYVAMLGVLTLTPGLTRTTFSVPLLHNVLAEPIETFTVTLSSPVNATLGLPTDLTINILDNDRALYLPLILN